MHEAVQPGGRSPKQTSGQSSTQQLKSGSDIASQIKGKRWVRGDQTMGPVMRERTSEIDDGNSAGCVFDSNMIKSELSKILEKGAILNSDGVEKLVHLMQISNSKKIDCTGRVLLADVISSTNSIDCLNKFMLVGGVAVLDEWLQDVHKGKTGEGYSPKESDKAVVEELLLTLLRALDKLPVNLHALQTCNIGKSVNHLRSHKNLEIQKKARSLVDTWKKRVDAEMKMSDAKPAGSSQTVTWQVKPGFSEAVSHAGNRHNGSDELSMKSTITQQSISKGLSVKSVHSDSTKLNTVIVGSGKLQSSSFSPVGIISKDSPSKDGINSGNLNPPQIAAKEENSTSSSQSCSSDHGKTFGSSLTTAGSERKKIGGSSCNRRLTNVNVASNILSERKESNTEKSGFLLRNTIGEKVSQAGLYCESSVDVLPSEHGSCHRLIDKLPNSGDSPARSTSGGSLDDPSAGSRTSSPCVLDNLEHRDRKVIGRKDAVRTHMDVNAESWQSNDVKEGLVGSDEGDRLSVIVPEEEQRDEPEKVLETPRTMCSVSDNEKFTGDVGPKLRDSFTSMNALIESCSKCSEATALLSLSGDDIGMNLLPCMAAGEMPKSNVISPASSPRGSLATVDPCTGTNESKSRFSSVYYGFQNLSPSNEITASDSPKHGKDTVLVFGKDETQVVAEISQDIKEEFHREEDGNQNKGDKRIGGLVVEALTDCKSVVSSPVDQIKTSSSSPAEAWKLSSDSGCKSLFHGIDCEVSASSGDVEKVVIAESSLSLHFNKDLHVGAILTEQKSHSVAKAETEMERKGDGAPTSSVADNDAQCLENADLLTGKMLDRSDCLEQTELNGSATLPSNNSAHLESSLSPGGMGCGAQTTEGKSALEKHREVEACANMSTDEIETKEELPSLAEISSFVRTSNQDVGAKLNFDLNEGMFGDDVNQTEPFSSSASDFSPAIKIPSSSPLVSSSIVNRLPSPVTVAAPAKGFFMPPEILLNGRFQQPPVHFVQQNPKRFLRPKKGRPLLEFDLNVSDESVLEDMCSQNSAQTTGSESGIIIDHHIPSRAAGRLNFDLNRLDEGAEDLEFVVSTECCFDVPPVHARPTTIKFSKGDPNMLREFDLNSGPGTDDAGTEQLFRSQNSKNSNNMQSVPPNVHIRMNNTEPGSGCFPCFNSYPGFALSSFLHDREQSYPIFAASGAQRILGPISGVGALGSEIYRAPVLSSSPAMAFSQASTTFSYALLPYGTTFPPPSSATPGSTNYVDSSSGGCSYFPHIPSLGGATTAVSSPYTRPYAVSRPEGGAAIGSDGRKWARQGLDLNAGPGCAEQFKDDPLSSSRQLHASSSQSFMEDQTRLFHVSGGVLKRKETDGDQLLFQLIPMRNYNVRNAVMLDIKNTFLNGDIIEKVYMCLPPGFGSTFSRRQVCRLRKSLYRLKQSPSVCGQIVILIVFVDDIILTGDDLPILESLNDILATSFEMNLGLLYSSEQDFWGNSFTLPILALTSATQYQLLGHAIHDRRFTSGYCSLVWGNLVMWKSKKQSVVARGSVEA
ncbi:uncharacterized protein LOC110019402 [Phalaenopsis equestris]|uniref:uncharacterized protein LOC110019402 n=1 Tax=Phalaenopsis equestris TaxID=78828 RepID=UPI0009E59460|nr:uncharacterized protein LOC110019402 [Phalaenopsis equestris]